MTKKYTSFSSYTRYKAQDADKDRFPYLVKARVGVPCVREYMFHPVRKWRFDYAIPTLKIAIECDGGIYTRGRHVRPTGYLRDMEKFNAAAMDGWLVVKFTPQQLCGEEAITQVRQLVRLRMEEAVSKAKAIQQIQPLTK